MDEARDSGMIPRRLPAPGTRRSSVSALVALAMFLGSAACGEHGHHGPPRNATGLRLDLPEASPGYVLVAPLRSRTTYLIDRQGKSVHEWRDNPLSPLSVYLLDDGTLLRCGRVPENPVFDRGGRSGRIERLAPDGSILWSFELCDGTRSLHHDIEPLPGGNILAIAWEYLSAEEAAALGRDPEHTSANGWWPDTLIEIHPTLPEGGEIVWEWRARDHLIQSFDPARPNYGRAAEHPERIDVNAELSSSPREGPESSGAEGGSLNELQNLGYVGDTDPGSDGNLRPGRQHRSNDWLHLNSVDFEPVEDLILVSSPELNEILILDHSTTTEQARGSSGGRRGRGGDVLYRWGNPRNYGCGTQADQQLFFQHMPEWIPPGLPGAGHVTIFNNGLMRRPEEFSSVDEIELPKLDPEHGFERAPQQAFAPARPCWSYSDGKAFYSFFISGAQRLPNGNTFICSGKQGRLFEVTPGKKIVWEYWNPYGGELEKVFSTGGRDLVQPTACFRATKILPDHPGLRALGLAR